MEPKRPCRPINLTHLMYVSAATNRITVTWGNYGKVNDSVTWEINEDVCGECPFSSSYPFPFSLELFGGPILSATNDLSRIAAEVENYWSQTSRALQGTW